MDFTLSIQRDTKNAHYGMLHIQDVPNFTYILNSYRKQMNTPVGCLIVGETQQDLDISKDGFIGSSAVAYKKMYAKVSSELLQGKEVTIEYTTINNLLSRENKNDSVYDKLQEINANVIKTNAMLRGRLIN